MSLNCFFGIEVRPDGVPVIPVIPPESSLIITQCSVTSLTPSDAHATGTTSSSSSSTRAYSPVTLYVQSNDIPKRFAVCTLSPQHRVTFCPLQLIFSKNVVFSLVGSEANGQKGGGKPRNGKQGDASETRAVFPTVHLIGYYESDERSDDSDDDEDDDEHDEMSQSVRGHGKPKSATGKSQPRSSAEQHAAKKSNGVKQRSTQNSSKHSGASQPSRKNSKPPAHHKRQR